MDAREKRIANVDIRWLIRRDMPEVIEIENLSFPNPWSEEEFLLCLRQKNCIGTVAVSELGGSVYGYMIYELHKEKLVLLNLAVAPEVRRTGIGTAMVQKLIDKLRQQKRRRITTEISEANLPAQLLFAGLGFKADRRVVDGQIQFQYQLTGSFPVWRGVNRMTECDAQGELFSEG